MEKYILGNKQFIGKQNEDLFVDVELIRNIETIKKDFINNDFDFQEQYILERNSSLKFCLYGIIESRYGNCDNLLITATIEDIDGSNHGKEVMYSPYKYNGAISGNSIQLLSKPLSDNNKLSKNIYGTSKGSYFLLFEINNINLKSINKTKVIHLEIFDSTKELFGNFYIPFLYFDETGEQIPFGTENAEISEDNNITEINNNFPFFFDKHWIKFNIEPSGPQVVSFEKESDFVLEEQTSKYNLNLTLEEPSKYGLELVKVIVDYGVDINGGVLTSAQLKSDFNYNEQIIKWSIGEQTKTIFIDIIDDLFVEPIVEKITFRIVPLSNARVSNNSFNKFTLNIQSGDIPIPSFFQTGTLNIKEPSININSTIQIDLKIIFEKPIPVNGESIKVQINKSETTAIIGTDFYIDSSNKNLNETILNVPLSASDINFQFTVVANKTYDIDKFITFDLIQNSPGISVVNRSNKSENPKCKITLTDGMDYKYIRYILPINETKGIGVYKTIYNNLQLNPKTTTLTKDTFNPNINFGTSQLNVTNTFNCKLQIQNLGDRIVWNDKYVHTNEFINIPLSFSSQTSDLILDLPTNYQYKFNQNSYEKASYKFKFIDIEKVYPINLPQNQYSVSDIRNDFEKEVVYKLETGGLSGSTKRYLVSTIFMANSQYDLSNDSCSLSATNLNQKIRYNGALLIPKGINNSNTSGTRTLLEFNPQRVANKCYFENDNLPVGIDYMPDGPFNERYARINFGTLWVQAFYSLNNLQDRMYLGAIDQQTLTTDKYRYYLKFSDLPVGSQTKIELHIKNNGDRDVTFLGRELPYNSTIILNSKDVNFNNLDLIFAANDDYSPTLNAFNKMSYKIEIKNIQIPNYANPNIYETVSIDLGNINERIPNIQVPTLRFLETEYKSVKVAKKLFGNVLCSSTIFNASSYTNERVIINGMLAQYKSKTDLKGVKIKSGKIVPDCPNWSIPFQII